MSEITPQEIQKDLRRPIKCLEPVNNKSKQLKSYYVYYPQVEKSSYTSKRLNVSHGGKPCFQLSSALPVMSGAEFSINLIPRKNDWLLSDLGMCHFYFHDLLSKQQINKAIYKRFMMGLHGAEKTYHLTYDVKNHAYNLEFKNLKQIKPNYDALIGFEYYFFDSIYFLDVK